MFFNLELLLPSQFLIITTLLIQKVIELIFFFIFLSYNDLFCLFFYLFFFSYFILMYNLLLIYGLIFQLRIFDYLTLINIEVLYLFFFFVEIVLSLEFRIKLDYIMISINTQKLNLFDQIVFIQQMHTHKTISIYFNELFIVESGERRLLVIMVSEIDKDWILDIRDISERESKVTDKLQCSHLLEIDPSEHLDKLDDLILLDQRETTRQLDLLLL